MEPKRSKYDTNPLDEDVVAHADQSLGSAQSSSPTKEVRGSTTRDIGRPAKPNTRENPNSEAPTRRIDDNIPTSYPSIFVPPHAKQSVYEAPRVAPTDIYQPPPAPPPTVYQAPAVYKSGSNTVAGLGIPERWAAMLPYLPVWPAIVIGIVELLLVPRTETRVRFHASQALAIQIGVTAISMLLTFGGAFSGRFTGAGLFNAASIVFLIIAMVRVWKGKPVAIPPLDEPRKWLEEKIKPRK